MLHRLKEPENYEPTSLATVQALRDISAAHGAGANVDAVFKNQGEGASLPLTVILDYFYGIAAYQTWPSKRGAALTSLVGYRERHYARLPPFPSDDTDDTDDTDGTVEPDNADSDYMPSDTSGLDDLTDSDYKLSELGKQNTSTTKNEIDLVARIMMNSMSF
jgi:hypothetical protein